MRILFHEVKVTSTNLTFPLPLGPKFTDTNITIVIRTSKSVASSTWQCLTVTKLQSHTLFMTIDVNSYQFCCTTRLLLHLIHITTTTMLPCLSCCVLLSIQSWKTQIIDNMLDDFFFLIGLKHVIWYMLASPVFLISFADLSYGCGNSCLVNVAAFLFSVKSTVFTSMDKNQ